MLALHPISGLGGRSPVVWLVRVVAVALLFVAVAPYAGRDACAETGEYALSIGAGAWTGTTTWGDEAEQFQTWAPQLHLAGRYGLSDYWQIGLSMDGGVGLGGAHDPGFVGEAHGDIFYFVDIITWVLYVQVGVGVLVRNPHPAVLLAGDALRADLSATAGLGLDYRPARGWSVGGLFRYQLIPTDHPTTAPALQLSLSWTLYFE